MQVWREGYNIAGAKDTAQLIGTVEARTLKQACDILLAKDELYDGEKLWGCRLFASETEARKSFG